MSVLHEIERRQIAEDWARITAERLQKSLLKHKVGQTGSLNYSIFYALKSMAGGDITSIIHEFNYYGKFVDMGVGRGQKIEDVKTNGDLISLLGHGRKAKKWFSKTYYSEALSLGELMGEKYALDVQEIIIDSLAA